MRHRYSLLIGCLLISSCSKVQAAEFFSDSEKDIPLRAMGKLEIRNPRGDIHVQGWAHDKIRIKIHKRVEADSKEAAQPLFDRVDFSHETSQQGKMIEISSHYSNSLGIPERLQEEASPRVRADITVFAPLDLNLWVWSISGKITLKSWNAPVQLRSNQGAIRAEDINSDSTRASCDSCVIQLKDIIGAVNCSNRTGQIELNHVQGKTIFAETEAGQIRVFQVQGDQSYVAQSGQIEGQILKGKVHFSGGKANIGFREISGFLSGETTSGNIRAHVRKAELTDQAFIESKTGNISLTLPFYFSGEVDFWSLRGKAEVEFPIEKSADLSMVGPEPDNHWVGRIREGGPLLQIYTDRGELQVLKDR